MINYRKPGITHFEIVGEVETLNAANNSVYIVTSKNREKRSVTRIEMSEQQVKDFIPYLYQVVKAQFIKGCLFIQPVTIMED
jgi:hypothetical protein